MIVVRQTMRSNGRKRMNKDYPEYPIWFNEESMKSYVSKYKTCDNLRDQHELIAGSLAVYSPFGFEKTKQHFFGLLFKGWLSPSSPVYSVGSNSRIMGVSCFGSYPEDSIDGFYKTYHEIAMLTKYGGGTSIYLGGVTERGIVAPSGACADGPLNVMISAHDTAQRVAQTGKRAGAVASYISVEHRDYPELLTHAKEERGINIGFNINRETIKGMARDGRQEKDIFNDLMDFRFSHGRGYIHKIDTVNRWNPTAYTNNGLLVSASNLCNEIELFSDPDHTFSCQPGYAQIIKRGEGLVELKDVNPGDVIWSNEGWTTVTNKISSGTKSVYEYFTSHGAFVGTEDHRIVQNGEKIEVDKARVIDKCSPPRQEEAVEAFIDPEEVLNGLLLGDGTIRNNKPVLCVGNKDQDYYTSEIAHLIDVDGYKYFRNVRIVPKVDLSILTYDRDIAPEIFKGKYNSLLRGLFSANGSVIKSKNGGIRVVLSQTSKQLSLKIIGMMQALGYAPKIYKRRGYNVTWKNGDYMSKDSYLITLLKIDDCIKFSKEVGFIQKYKQDLLRAAHSKIRKKRTDSNWIKSKTFIENCEVFHIEVNNDSHTYWSGGLNVSNCVLSSLNLSKYDEWKDTDAIYWCTVFLDCLVSYFLDKAKGKPGMERTIRATTKGRAIGLGVCGFHSYLQERLIPMDSMEAYLLNGMWFKEIKKHAVRASRDLAVALGEPEWCKGTGMRNTHLLAVPPTLSTASLMGGISEGINPFFGVAYLQKYATGLQRKENRNFVKLCNNKGLDFESLKEDIEAHDGSIQHLSQFDETEKAAYKNCAEIDQMALIRMASVRQQSICQSQSLDLHYTEDTPKKVISQHHKALLLDPYIKGAYYLRTMKRIKYNDIKVCEACQ